MPTISTIKVQAYWLICSAAKRSQCTILMILQKFIFFLPTTSGFRGFVNVLLLALSKFIELKLSNSHSIINKDVVIDFFTALVNNTI